MPRVSCSRAFSALAASPRVKTSTSGSGSEGTSFAAALASASADGAGAADAALFDSVTVQIINETAAPMSIIWVDELDGTLTMAEDGRDHSLVLDRVKGAR